MPTIAELEQAFRDAKRAAKQAHEAKDEALKNLNGFGTVDKRTKRQVMTAPAKPRVAAKREYEVAKAAYARAARTANIAAKALEDAGGSSLAALERYSKRSNGRKTATSPVYLATEGRFFADLVHARERGPSSDAALRLERHLRATGQVERRQSGMTQGAGFAAPDFYAEAWADVPRTAAPVFASMPKLPLPAFGLDAYVPAWTTGSEAAVQTKSSGVNNAVQVGDSTPVASSQVTAHLVTVAENWNVDRQPLERARPGWDISFGRDMAAAIYEKLDDALINGNGGDSHIGLLNVSGAGSFNASGATDAQKQLRALAEAAASMYSTRHALPTHAVLSPARALSLFSGVTSAGSPLVPQGALPSPGIGDNPEWPVGMLLPGVRAIVSDKIADDTIVLWRASDSLIAVDDNPLVFDAEQLGSSAMSVHLIGWLYSQAFLHRIPASVMVVSSIPAVSW